MVIWITGLSGSGKTALGKKIVEELQQRGFCVVHLDGDDLRRTLAPLSISASHRPADRAKLAEVYSNLAFQITSQIDFVVVSTISMFKTTYDRNRSYGQPYFEIYLRSIVDPEKSLGFSGAVAGRDFQVDIPTDPDFVWSMGQDGGLLDIQGLISLVLEKKSLNKKYE